MVVSVTLGPDAAPHLARYLPKMARNWRTFCGPLLFVLLIASAWVRSAMLAWGILPFSEFGWPQGTALPEEEYIAATKIPGLARRPLWHDEPLPPYLPLLPFSMRSVSSVRPLHSRPQMSPWTFDGLLIVTALGSDEMASYVSAMRSYAHTQVKFMLNVYEGDAAIQRLEVLLHEAGVTDRVALITKQTGAKALFWKQYCDPLALVEAGVRLLWLLDSDFDFSLALFQYVSH